jgi:hypothetical protein
MSLPVNNPACCAAVAPPPNATNNAIIAYPQRHRWASPGQTRPLNVPPVRHTVFSSQSRTAQERTRSPSQASADDRTAHRRSSYVTPG